MARSDPNIDWPGALSVDLSTGAAAAAGAYSLGEWDLIGACHHKPIAVVSACPAGRRHPIPLAKGGAITTLALPVSTQVTIGVDTHLDEHVAAAHDILGRHLGTISAPTTPVGYHSLLGWAQGLGEVDAWGIEGTGSFGASLARFLRAHGQVVIEVNRPDRAARRRRGQVRQ